MRKIKALLIATFAFLASIMPIWAADFLPSETRYAAVAYSSDMSDLRATLGLGSSEEAAIADSMRKCLGYTDDCTPGVAAPWEWTHLLIHCPKFNLLTAIAVSPDKSQKIVDDMVLSSLGWDHINFKCSVIGGDWEGQPVISWLINTH